VRVLPLALEFLVAGNLAGILWRSGFTLASRTPGNSTSRGARPSSSIWKDRQLERIEARSIGEYLDLRDLAIFHRKAKSSGQSAVGSPHDPNRAIHEANCGRTNKLCERHCAPGPILRAMHFLRSMCASRDRIHSDDQVWIENRQQSFDVCCAEGRQKGFDHFWRWVPAQLPAGAAAPGWQAAALLLGSAPQS